MNLCGPVSCCLGQEIVHRAQRESRAMQQGVDVNGTLGFLNSSLQQFISGLQLSARRAPDLQQVR